MDYAFPGSLGIGLALVRIHLVRQPLWIIPVFQKLAFLTGHYCTSHWDLLQRASHRKPHQAAEVLFCTAGSMCPHILEYANK